MKVVLLSLAICISFGFFSSTVADISSESTAVSFAGTGVGFEVTAADVKALAEAEILKREEEKRKEAMWVNIVVWSVILIALGIAATSTKR